MGTMRTALLLSCIVLTACGDGEDFTALGEDGTETTGIWDADIPNPDDAPDLPDIPDPGDEGEATDATDASDPIDPPDGEVSDTPEVEEPEVEEPEVEEIEEVEEIGDLPDVDELDEGPGEIEDPGDPLDVPDIPDVPDPGDDGEDPPDIPDAPDEGTDEGCAAYPDPPKPLEFPITIGKLLGNKTFVDVEDGEAIEIIQGPQGGVHVEVVFHITLPDTFTGSSVKAEVDSLSFQPCCGAEKVGDYFNKKSLLYKQVSESQTFYSGVIPVIFDQDLAMFYEDEACCVTIDVGVYAKGTNEIVTQSTAQHTFMCVDFF